ncbi:hypothetical protein [Calothrix sp. 336/3]|uniref:hypothetical protein n=1 Tax=Calothrix sp. 336/3 TaxID=1337936 RepID=UPI000624C8E8|nr:hypothetical protein [Calothrix sp. 336/3]AKG20222.1 hypothetical protein IJ00_01880 [Calothrix sp. 336/3]
MSGSHDSESKNLEPNQQEQRRAALQEFLESLEQLEDILQEEENEPIPTPPIVESHESKENPGAIDLAAWEDAVADIEQYMAKKKGKEKG